MNEYSSNNYDDMIFVTIAFIFILEILIGVVQLLGAFIRTMIFLNKGQQIGKLKTYWIVIGIYFTIYIGINLADQYIRKNYFLYDETSEYNYYKLSEYDDYILYIYIFCILAAWPIAMWYSYNIVFKKRTNKSINTLILKPS